MLRKIKLFIGNLAVRFVKFIARTTKIDLLRIAYRENGIMNSHSMEASGEIFFTQSFLKSKIKNSNPTFLDVGGNKGDYSALLNQAFPQAKIYTFEPNPNTFEVLKKRLEGKVELVNKGVGNKNGELELYFDQSDKTSVQATSDPEILKVIAGSEQLQSETIAVTTLDDFCKSNQLMEIDLLKIDTEGFELEALEGAKELLGNNAISIIQFEFNEVNIVKRRYLRDFYDTLENFDFYRLHEKKLIPLGDWQPIHEIYLFQNIIAIRK